MYYVRAYWKKNGGKVRLSGDLNRGVVWRIIGSSVIQISFLFSAFSKRLFLLFAHAVIVVPFNLSPRTPDIMIASTAFVLATTPRESDGCVFVFFHCRAYCRSPSQRPTPRLRNNNLVRLIPSIATAFVTRCCIDIFYRNTARWYCHLPCVINNTTTSATYHSRYHPRIECPECRFDPERSSRRVRISSFARNTNNANHPGVTRIALKQEVAI